MNTASGVERLASPKVCVKINNLHKTYLLGIEGVPALRGVTAEILSGQFVMLLGKSGSGKTSLLNLIGTIDQPTRGELQVCGLNIRSRMSDADLASLRLHHLGFVFQTFNLIPSMTALENVLLPSILKDGSTTGANRERAIALLTRVGMLDRVDHFPSQLSGGEQQRVTIARALINSPTILLLDEPTGDLDSKNTEIVMKLLMELNVQENVTMVMVTHDPSLKSFAHKCFHMMDGRIYSVEKIDAAVRARKIRDLGIATEENFSVAVHGGEKVEEKKKAAVTSLEQSRMTEVRTPSLYTMTLGDSLVAGEA
jgi:putative ABC transport system ATP-binding protein